MNEPLLHIHRWRNDFFVPQDGVAPERARADLDNMAGRLVDELTVGLAPWLLADAEPVVLVERLAFDCELDLSREPELLVARWAYQFAKALINATESGGDGVLRFSSPAAYRAQFIADSTGGSSGTAWYYRSFSGLAALPPAGAIRTLLLEDPQLGRETLMALPLETWDRLGSALTCRESLRILEGLSGEQSLEATEPTALAALYQDQAPQLPSVPWFVAALCFFSAALRAGYRPTADLAQWVRLAAKLSALGSRPDVLALAEAIRQGNLAALITVDNEKDAETWAILAVRPNWRSTLADILQTDSGRTSAGSPRAAADVSYTAFGGLALLLPKLDEMLDKAVSEALPPTDFAQPRALAAWLVLAQCAGQARAVQFVGESFWRDLFTIPEEIDREKLRLWLIDSDTIPVAERLAERAAALARGTGLSVRLRVGGQRCLIVLDQLTGLWREIGSPDTESFNVSRDEKATPSSDPIPPPSWRTRLATTRRVRDDWRYLVMDWGLPDPWQWLFMYMAQIVLRRFAYRIPGFADASLPYIYANFLDSSGTLDPESGHLQLARPPLHVLLSFTGIGRGTLHWSGPPKRSLILDYPP